MTDRPNLLFLMADQYRHDYLGCAGADFVRTPNLDRIAARGVRFTNCFSNSPVCAPARIGLASGLRPDRLGALDNSSFLPARTPTYYQRLRDHGYRVGCVGKLDLAKPDAYNGRWGDRPRVYGWGFTHPEECEGKMHAGRVAEPHGPYGFWLREQGLFERFREDYAEREAKGWVVDASHDSVLPAEAFEDCYIGRRAAEWLERVPDDFPWHYFVSFVGPHNPFDPPAEFAEPFRDAEVPGAIQDPLEDKPAWHEDRVVTTDPEVIALTRRQYCGAIAAIDDAVGRVLDVLESRGVLENTVVVFSSDHGEMLGDHGMYTKQKAYEPSWRVPLIVAGPGVDGGRKSDAMVELIDVNPTLTELAGTGVAEDLDARSLAPLLGGEAPDHREDVFATLRHLRCLRTDRHKLVENYGDVWELYDLQDDPDELHNLADDEPELLAAMKRQMRARHLEGKGLR